MLEHVPHWLGSALKGLRAGQEKLAIVQPQLGSFGGEARLRFICVLIV